MLATGFILSTNILDLCSDQDISPVLPAYVSSGDHSIWPRPFCDLEGFVKRLGDVLSKRRRGSEATSVNSSESSHSHSHTPSSDTDVDNLEPTSAAGCIDAESVTGGRQTTYLRRRHSCCLGCLGNHHQRPAGLVSPLSALSPVSGRPSTLIRSHSDSDIVRSASHVRSGSIGDVGTLKPSVNYPRDAVAMGNVCSCCPCCPGNEGYGRVGDVDPDNERTSLVRGKQNKRYDFEQKVLDEHVMTNSIIKQAAIFSYKNGDIRATAPRGFNPDRVGIKNILRAMKGIDSSGLAENGINLGSGTRVSTPGKLDQGKAIYGSDGQGGGCTVFKANECVLIVFFDSEIAQGTRLASEVAEYMSEQGY